MSDSQVTLSLSEYTCLVEENARMEGILRSIQDYAKGAPFGGWRHDINAFCKRGLGE